MAITYLGSGRRPAISGTNVVWSNWEGNNRLNDYEIYYWNGSTTVQLTNNSTDDQNPDISGTNVV